jgi:periplasmic protein TonB
MTNNEILKADMLDILFENRNKTYGAYTLRKEYNARLGTSLGVALSAALLIFLISLVTNNGNQEPRHFKNESSVILTLIELPKDKPKEPEKPKEIVKEKIKQVKSSNKIQIVKENIPADVPEQKDITDAIVGNENVDGKALDDPDKIVKTEAETGNDQHSLTQGGNKEFAPMEVAPTFPGGISAWLNFLRRYLQTPGEVEAGQKVAVLVKFWIGTDGSLSGFEIIKSGGDAYDKEVLRVMKKMPKWEPAVQNHTKVAVAFTQPVIFVGSDE